MKFMNKNNYYYIKANYKPNIINGEKVRILNKKFIRNNHDKCKIIYNNKLYKLKEYFEDINNDYNHQDLIKIKIIFFNNIINISYIFYECKSLISFFDIYKSNKFNYIHTIEYDSLFDSYNKKNTNNIFIDDYLSSISANPSKSKSNEKSDKFIESYKNIYITNLIGICGGCKSLKSLPDISKWNISKVKNMNKMFYECISLNSIPDISEWNTSNVKDMSQMFYKCKSLISLPNINKWNFSNIEDMSDIFDECKNSSQMQEFLLSKILDNFIKKDYAIFELKYQINQKNIEKVRIFGRTFALKNKGKCKIIYKNKINNLYEYLEDIDNNNTYNNLIKLYLCVDINIEDLSHIFNECKSLISFQSKMICSKENIELNEIDDKSNSIIDYYNLKNYNINNSMKSFDSFHLNINYNNSTISKKNETHSFSEDKNIESFCSISFHKLTNMEYMFHRCNKLKYLSEDISKWKTDKVVNMSYMFHGCNELISVPDLSKWNTDNVKNMSYMFFDCYSLISIPDISKWNKTNENLENLNNMFSGCTLLKSLPNLSEWNTKKVINLRYMFHGCNSLISLHDISKWKITNANNISNMFHGCKSLISLPDLSKWNTIKVKEINDLFRGCSSLLSLPDISKWDITNVSNISGIFYGCNSLTTIPDISKWNTNNVTNMSYLFRGCSSLISIPNISKWNIDNIRNISGIFNGCFSLISLPDISIWNTNNVTNMSFIFDKCYNSINLISKLIK